MRIKTFYLLMGVGVEVGVIWGYHYLAKIFHLLSLSFWLPYLVCKNAQVSKMTTKYWTIFLFSVLCKVKVFLQIYDGIQYSKYI